MQKIICFAHKRDLDGIGCHAILKRHAKKHGIEIENVYVDYGDLIREIRKREDVRNSIIVIADMGFSDNFINHIDLFKKISNRNIVYWMDHHNWDKYKDIIKFLNIKFIIDKDLCASEIVYNFFDRNDEISKKISRLARIHDFMLTNDDEFNLAFKIYEVISSHMLDYDYIAEELSNGNFWNESFEQIYNRYNILKRYELEKCRKNLRIYKVCGLKFGITLYSNISATTVSYYLLNEYDLDFIVCCTKKGRLSFRRRNKKVDMVEISELFGGGGREDASSASYGREISEKDFDEIASVIVNHLNKKYAGDLDEMGSQSHV